MYASIEPNEYNRLAQEIKEKQEELERREAVVVEKEAVSAEDKVVNDRVVAYVIAISSLLLILVILNFYLDWRRRK